MQDNAQDTQFFFDCTIFKRSVFPASIFEDLPESNVDIVCL